MKKNQILIKIGGSLITDKTKKQTAKPEIIKRLGLEILAFQTEYPNTQIIVGHGAGSFGHFLVKEFGDNYAEETNANIIQESVQKLNDLVTKTWEELGLKPKKIMFGQMRKNPANKLWRVVSTEQLFDEYINENPHSIDKATLVTDVDGLINPKDNSIIEEVNDKNFDEVKKHIFDDHKLDVTGAMQLKLTMAKKWNRCGIKTIILNGNTPGRLEKYLRGEKIICTKLFE